MFELVRSKIDLIEYIESTSDFAFKSCGTDTFELEDKSCPFCGHNDCFKVKHDPASPENSFYHCFSCEEHGDVISWKQAKEKMDSPLRAARTLCEEFTIEIPREYTPVQQVFDMAADYYHNLLISGDVKPSIKLNDMTPLEFQMKRRRHTQDGISNFKVGWSDGGLCEYLSSVGFDDELLELSGLKSLKGKKGDFLPADCFIYPHFVKGKVSHFTFKDPLKKLEYQLPNKFKLNGYMGYGQDSVNRSGQVLLVEGENDLISVWESGWTGAIMATIGQLSGAQVEWLASECAGKEVLTIFDNDDAGVKYRERVEKVSVKFEKLTQYTPTEVKDIDEYLKSGMGHTILEAFTDFHHEVKEAPEEDKELVEAAEEASEEGRTAIFEKEGAYFKLKFKEGVPSSVKVSNFTIRLRNIFIQGQSREREIVIIREDGRRSQPVVVTSEVKVSLKPFKTLMANAIDASFYGSEQDMIGVWEKVYSGATEKEVHLPQVVGHNEQFRGWLFRDTFISNTGAISYPDAEGVFWVGGANNVGIKPISLNTDMNSSSDEANGDIPILASKFTTEERSQLEHEFVKMFATNLGDIGIAITMLAWAKANAYSNIIYKKFGFFPFLFLWGKHGKGKTFISKWILSLFGMAEVGYTTISQLKSGVGLERKIGYYGSLPVCIDEIRSDKETVDFQGTFRAWYNRSKRTMGIRDGFGIREKEVLSTFLFAGQDRFSDSAARQRCVSVRVPINGRETQHSFKWIEDNRVDLSAIGYNWIMESAKRDPADLIGQICSVDSTLTSWGVNPRTAKNWAIITVFGNQIADQCFPGYDFNEYVRTASIEDSVAQEDDDVVAQFFGIIEGMQVGDRPLITTDHVRQEGKYLYIWFAEVFRIIQERSSGVSQERFSRNAVKHAILEEDWCAGEGKTEMGLAGTRRSCIKVEIDKAPDAVKTVAAFLGADIGKG